VGLLGTHWAIKFDFLIPFTYRFEPRITGLPGAEQGISPNEVAGALLWVIPPFLFLSLFALTQLKQLKLTARRWFIPATLLAWEATFFIIFVFLLCQSRGGYLAFAISGLLCILVLLWGRRRWLFSSLLVVGIMIAVFAGAGGAEQPVREIFENRMASDRSLSIDTLTGRVKVWSRALLGIEKYPLTGMGMNTFRYQVNMLAPLEPIYVGQDTAHAHNEFLQVALDLGIPGLCAFVVIYHMAFWMLSQVWRMATKEMRRPPGPYDNLWNPRLQRYLVAGLGGGLFAHLLYSSTDVVALGAKPGILFWMLLGLVVCLYSNRMSELGNPA